MRHKWYVNVVTGAVATAVAVAAAQPASAGEPHLAEAKETAAAVVEATGTTGVVTATARDADSAVIAQTAAGTVDVPLKIDDAVSVGTGSVKVEIGLPHTTDNAAVRMSNGTVVYADEEAPVDVAVQPTAEGVRALVAIKDETAPKEYRFPVDGPAGSRLVSSAELLGAENDTGEVLLVAADGTALGLFEPAWAKDANGQAVPTSYRIEGSSLVQVVDVDENTAFPVVADPNWWKVAKCAGALAWLVGTNIFVVAKIVRIRNYINALGGFRRAAELMLRASTWEERMRYGGGALAGLASEVLGVAAVRDNCTG